MRTAETRTVVDELRDQNSQLAARIKQLEAENADLKKGKEYDLYDLNQFGKVQVRDEIDPKRGIFLYHEAHSFSGSNGFDVTQIYDWGKQTIDRALSTGANGVANHRFAVEKVLMNRQGDILPFLDQQAGPNQGLRQSPGVPPAGDQGYTARDICRNLPPFSKEAKLHVKVWLEYPVKSE